MEFKKGNFFNKKNLPFTSYITQLFDDFRLFFPIFDTKNVFKMYTLLTIASNILNLSYEREFYLGRKSRYSREM